MTLQTLDKNLKKILIYYLVTLGVGFSLGVFYVYLNSEFSSSGMVEQYVGNNDEWEPKLPKTLQDLVSHTHEHITMFSIIFLSLGLIFLYNNTIKGFWKRFLILEPFVSIIITFGGFFIIRYVTTSFSYIIMISSLLMYICFYVMLFISLYELIILNKEN